MLVIIVGKTVVAVLATIGACIDGGHSWLSSCEIANRAAGLGCQKMSATPVGGDEL